LLADISFIPHPFAAGISSLLSFLYGDSFISISFSLADISFIPHSFVAGISSILSFLYGNAFIFDFILTG
jgi:hypothetical protein